MRLLLLFIATGFALSGKAPVNRDQDLKDYFSNRITYQALIDYQAQIRTANVSEP